MTSEPFDPVAEIVSRIENINIEVVNSIINHLEFLGYEVTTRKGGYHAAHPRKYNFNFFRLQSDVVYFTMFFEGKEYGKVMKDEVYNFLNMFNGKTFVSHFTLNDDFDVVSSLSYVGEYNKTTFARMFELWEGDVDAMAHHKSSSDFLSLK